MSTNPVGLVALAAALAALATWLVRRSALAVGFMDQPNPIVPQHVRPVAYGGGLAVVLGAAGTLAITQVIVPLKFWSPAVLFLLLGLYDDKRRLAPGPKFLLQVLVTGLAVWLGVSAPWTGLAGLDAVLSALAILTWINAANFTDVCDGLLSGLAVIGLAGFALLAEPWAPLAWISAGGCLGFLLFNRPPAAIFLGDAGSGLVGYLLAAFALEFIAASQRPLLALTQSVLFASVPLFELLFLTAVRILKGLPWWRGSRDHFSLRLQAAGYSRLETDLWAWGAALVFAVVALVLPGLSLLARWVALGMVLLSTGLAAVWLKRHEVPPKAAPAPQ